MLLRYGQFCIKYLLVTTFSIKGRKVKANFILILLTSDIETNRNWYSSMMCQGSDTHTFVYLSCLYVLCRWHIGAAMTSSSTFSKTQSRARAARPSFCTVTQTWQRLREYFAESPLGPIGKSCSADVWCSIRILPMTIGWALHECCALLDESWLHVSVLYCSR